MIQNQIVGRRWRLVPVTDLWHTPDLRSIKPYDDLPGLDELEGFSMIDPAALRAGDQFEKRQLHGGDD